MKPLTPLATLIRLTLLLTLAIAPALHAATDEKPRREGAPEHRERDRAQAVLDAELAPRLDRLQARVKELTANGKHEEAEKLEGHIRELRNHSPDRASGERERRHKAEKHLESLRREIAELHRAGNNEAAEKLEVQALRLGAELESSQRGPGRPDREVLQSKEKLHAVLREIEELHRAGKHEEAERLEERVRDVNNQAGQHGDRRGEVEEIERLNHRLGNLSRAIDHLREAEMHELASELSKEARASEERLDQLIEKKVQRENERTARLANEVAELRALVGELRGQVERLTRRLEERPREP